MTSQDADHLAQDFGVTFPQWYQDAIAGRYPLDEPTDELETDAQILRDENAMCRDENPWGVRGFQWQPSFWWIGADGRGGGYFIDTNEAGSTVYYIDHDDPPATFGGDDRLERKSYTSFIDALRKLVQESRKEIENHSAEMARKVANRKWWQFWIPRT